MPWWSRLEPRHAGALRPAALVPPWQPSAPPAPPAQALGSSADRGAQPHNCPLLPPFASRPQGFIGLPGMVLEAPNRRI